MSQLGLQIVFWVVMVAFLLAAILGGLGIAALWVVDRLVGWVHRRLERPRLR